MKVTKKLTAEIKKFMKTYWDTYLKGDLKTWATFVPADYKNIGGTEEEIWNTRKEILDYTKRMSNQMVGQAEIRNTKTQLIPYDPYMMIHEFMDMFIKVDKKWTFYGKFRLSSILQKTGSEWKVLHQHGSYPDSKTAEGEAFAFDTLKSQIIKLQKAVENRTAELVLKNRELEVEASLEKVRSQTMAMQKSDELQQVIQVVYDQFVQLGFPIGHTGFILDYKNREDMYIWLADQNQIHSQITLPYFDSPHWNSYLKAKKTKSNFFANYLDFEAKNKFYKQIFSHIHGIPKKTQQYYFKIPGLAISTVLLDNVGLYVENFEGIRYTEEENAILLRFGKVFQQAYTRFLDLQKAEAQAREAEIQLGLERVRARSLAMHKSEELSQVMVEMYKQLEELHISPWGCELILCDEQRDALQYWSATALKSALPEPFNIPRSIHPLFDKQWRAWKNGNDSLVIVIEGNEKKEFDKLMLKKSEFRKYPTEIRKYIRSRKKDVYTHACFRYGLLESIGDEPLIEPDFEILKRFAKVFEQSYTRFLDLQKAEAQAREAQIEVALERVRAKTMGMHSSNELLEIVDLLYSELSQLHVELARVVLLTVNPETLGMHWWMASPEKKIKTHGFLVPPNDLPMTLSMNEALKNKRSFWSYILKGKDKKAYDKFLFSKSELSQLPEEVQMGMASAKTMHISGYCNNFGLLTTSTLEPLSGKNSDLLTRFGQVFEQTYTRFLDLQKAEAQARESQIQLALERVRARTMAMQSSTELAEVSYLLNKQVVELGIPTRGCAFNIYNEHDATEWFSNLEGTMPTYKTPREKVFLNYYEAGQRGETLFIEAYSGKKIKDHYRYLFKAGIFGKDVTEGKIKEITPEIQIDHVAYFKYGYLLFITLVPAPEAHDVFKRFAKEFEQTYTRFLDLQKAEAQAREAQIEAGLERVRAQAMAMHHSDDLGLTIEIFYEQLSILLSTPIVRCGAGLLNPENFMAEMVTASKNDSGKTFHVKGNIDMTGHPLLQNTIDHWHQQKEYYHVLKGKEITKYYQYMTNQIATSDFSKNDEQHFYFPMFKEGSFYIITKIELPAEELQAVRRFASVLSLTYRRFNDLQKAEAQAREAQIETVLERVRAQTMAMHNSEDVGQCVVKMFGELTSLGVDEGTRFGIGILNHDNENNQLWTAIKDGEEVKMHIGNLDMTAHPLLKSARKAWKAQVPLHQYILEGDDLLQYYQMLNTSPDYKIQIPIEKLLEREFHYGFIFEHGFFYAFTPHEFQPELIRITQRFSSLFEQTYRRYLDLVRAEAQAKEAQIEAALERVRSKALAMHNSKDLPTTASVVFTELKKLGVEPMRSGISIQNKKNRNILVYSAAHTEEGEGLSLVGSALLDDHTVLAEIYDRWLRDEDYFPVLNGELLRTYYEKISGNFYVPQEQAEPEQFGYFIPFTHGMLYGWSLNPIDENEKKLIRRFASVVDLTFKRYFDLQKAEAQAREAQIEAALERVRSRTMAMHKSEELSETAAVLFEQFQVLGNTPERINLGIFNEESGHIEWWVTTQEGDQIDNNFITKYDDHPVVTTMLNGWKAKKKSTVISLAGKAVTNWIEYITKIIGMPVNPDLTKEKRYLSLAYFSQGSIGATTSEPLPPDTLHLLERFAGVFEQTYTRFLDLQKAEAQAREAQIEAALERVRSRAMAMQQSTELKDVVSVMIQNLQSLEVEAYMCEIVFFEDEFKSWKSWLYIASKDNLLDFEFSGLYFDHPFNDHQKNAYQRGLKYTTYVLEGENKKRFDELFHQHMSGPNLLQLEAIVYPIPRTVFSLAYLNQGVILVAGETTLSEEGAAILQRFAKVVDLTYARVDDLQKAETRTRESQIELALERVRAASMAMHTSQELSDVITVVADQFQQLKIRFDHVSFAINSEAEDYHFWTFLYGRPRPYELKVPYMDNPIANRAMEIRAEGLKFYQDTLTPEQNREWLEHVFKHNPADYLSAEEKEYVMSRGFSRSFAMMPTIILAVGNYASKPYNEDENQIIKRFAAVFEQSYTRFLDLKKSEAQTREALIEAALERVRSRSLAMHKSEDLLEVINTVSEQLQQLGIKFHNTSFGINSEGKDYSFWMSSKDDPKPFKIDIPYLDNPIPNRVMDAFKKGVDFFADTVPKKEVQQWHNHAYKHIARAIPDKVKDFVLNSNGFARSTVLMKNIFLTVGNYAMVPYSENENEIFKRFAKVFDQSYTRFLDLQKAEAQAREAQIEAALERVRARSMAMHKSEELLEVIAVVSEQLQHLHFRFDHTSFAVNNEEHDYKFWTAVIDFPTPIQLDVPYLDNPMFERLKEAKKNGEKFFTDILSEKENSEWQQHMLDHTAVDMFTEDAKKYITSRGMARSIAIMPNIMLMVVNYASVPYSEGDNKIIARFGQVFEQSYTRFLDLQKAEAQAREAQIEAALERIRARALAMHSSSEITDVAQVLREQMSLLNQPALVGCVIHIYPENSDMFDAWFAFRPSGQNELLAGTVSYPKNATALTRKWVDIYQSEETEYTIYTTGEEFQEWVAFRDKAIGNYFSKVRPNSDFNYYHFSDFSGGSLLISASEEPTAEVKDLQRRAATVFDLAYKRHIDLLSAEVREREAIKQAALDRVRGEIASMRSTKDLQRITPLVWQELTAMEIPFTRCGVFIMDESEKLIHAYLSGPGGQSLGILHVSFDSTEFTSEAIEQWRQQKNFITHWDQDQFVQNMRALIEQGQLKEPSTYQGADKPPESLHLHFIHFKQGMLYVGNDVPLKKESVASVKTLADSFSVAYARYEDFKKLEEAKTQIENTLTDLKAAQSQLVQSEKMASLGELTAGIAHEIQNPLNFVNNFSEVSGELIKEIQDERRKTKDQRDEMLTDEILNDIEQNLEKINHHGKRAGDIVKGMLQHSRVGSGKKEPTDINALCDEYLRLAYHGLRAKDKSFNSKFETDFDESIEKINVIPQDIGRVVLNLITNAFYAVHQQRTTNNQQLEPLVTVRTKYLDGQIEISVRDNGSGIPEHIKEKIFQPFFTTKPTGQGTGLGLSLSYDIVKAHGGELRVETKEGEGSEFIIQLTP